MRFEVVDPRSPDADWAIAQYFAVLDAAFPAGFDPGEGGDGARDLMRAPHGVFVVLRSADGIVVGCGGVQLVDETIGEIKRMWISADRRGAGLGKRMLAQLEELAAELGATRVILDTNSALTNAIAMYRSAGYQAIPRYNDNPYAQHWFEKRLA